MKITIDFPKTLLRKTEATAAKRGQLVSELIQELPEAHLQRLSEHLPREEGWRKVFGRASRAAVAEVDVILREFDQTDPEPPR